MQKSIPAPSSSTRSRRWRWLVWRLPIVLLAVVIGHLALSHAGFSAEQQELSRQLLSQRQTIERVTNIRRDARKTYVAAIERWLSNPATWPSLEAPLRARQETLRTSVAAFRDQAGLSDAEQQARKDLLQTLARWAVLFDTIEANTNGPDAREASRKLIDEIDVHCTAILKASLETASADDLAQASLLRNQSRSQLGLVVALALLAIYLSGWLLRAGAVRRLEQTLALQKIHEDHRKHLEQTVAERTAELEISNGRLRENMEDLSLAKRDLEARVHELAIAQGQLVQAEKLQAVGQLAAGIAHEINTPVQYVGDSISFLSESFDATNKLLRQYRAALARLNAIPEGALVAAEMLEAESEEDLDYVTENAPRSFSMATEGITRIATIVRALKAFAHADTQDKSPADINRAIETTMIIAQSEYKYVAVLETDLSIVPPVECHVGALNQVFLNLIVNAAHAIADVVAGTEEKGKILISTRHVGECVEISVSDSGVGIPAHLHARIFEPFYTTKEVGKGTGQGLAIAHAIVVNKHGGEIGFSSEPGKGTTFVIRLPVVAQQAAAA